MNKTFPTAKTLLTLFSITVAFSATAEPAESLVLLRLRGPHTDGGREWAENLAEIVRHPGAIDEIWFSTGIGVPNPADMRAAARRIAAAAEDVRRHGIRASLQIQATLGHGDEVSALEPTDGKSWGGFTGRGGVECRYCNCPRQPAFLDYLREMARCYAAFKPDWVWIDDDLRIAGHAPGSPWKKVADGYIGCWCKTCIAAFGAETGTAWTRETLDAAMKKDPKLFDRWEKFSFASIAEVARVIATEMHAVSPDTRFGYQHGAYRNNSQKAVFRALYEASGHKVGSRPGGGGYYDFDPHAQGRKALEAAHQRKVLGNDPTVAVWCPEVETYPRAFASRTSQGVLNESLVNLAYGMNAISYLIMDTRSERASFYGRTLLKDLAAEAPMMKAYRAWNRDAEPAGFVLPEGLPAERLYAFALTGVPVLNGPGHACGTLSQKDCSVNLCKMSSADLLDLYRRMDERSGGRLPVRPEDPVIALVVPQVTSDGILRSVMIENARIDALEPLKLRLRGVPSGVRRAEWRAFRAPTTTVDVLRDGTDAQVILPRITAWNCGWLRLGEP